MKKWISSVLAICLIVSLVACNSNTDTAEEAGNQTQSESNVQETMPPADESELPDEQLGGFIQTASIAETVMVDENGVRITATGLNYTNYSVELALTIENNSGKDLSFISGSLGYSCNSINGYMVSEGYLNCDVADGKKANETISFSYSGLMLYGIDEIADIEIGFDISDEDYNHTYSGPRQVRTSAFDGYDYSEDRYQNTITDRATMNAYGYDITHFSQENLYNVNDITLLSSGVMVNQDGETSLLLELENRTEDRVYLSTSDIALNGLVVSSSTWSSTAINPGKRCIIVVELSSVLAPEHWSIYGINEVGSVALSLNQLDPNGNYIAEERSIEIMVPGVDTGYDATGEEVYRNNGLRIVAKTILEDSSEYSSDMYVLMLAENTSGRTLTIDDTYDSLSVNGYMTDYSFYSAELADGESAALEIRLQESSLEENQIASVSDISEIEVGFEIKADRDIIDEPTVLIQFDS